MNRGTFVGVGIRVVAVAMTVIASMVPGCVRAPLSGPPQMRLGRHECAECGMLIDEDRCSSALLVDRPGERLYLFFDDLGCMLDHQEGEAADFSVVDQFVHDYGTREWIQAPHAVYLLAENAQVRTPMGSRMVAFAKPADAERLRDKAGGELLDLSALVVARRGWRESVYGTPGSPPAQTLP